MSVYLQSIIPAATGHAPDMDSASAPEDKARLLEGVWPARLGITHLCPIPKLAIRLTPRNSGEQIQGYAIYKNQLTTNLQRDLLIFTDRNLYIVPIVSSGDTSQQIYTYISYVYDLIARGQRANFQPVKGLFGTQAAPNGFASVPSPSYPAGAAPTCVQGTLPAGTSMQGNYGYVWCWQDALGVQGPVSAAGTVTISLGFAAVVTRGAGATPAGAIYWSLYRLNPGASVYRLVGTIPVATTVTNDSYSDAVIAARAAAPASPPTSPNSSSDWTLDSLPGTINNIAWEQFGNELIFTATISSGGGGNNLWRYYRDDTGAQFLYSISILAGGAPTISATGVGVLNGVYQYIWTWVDEQGREGSPSDPVTTATLTNNSQTVTRGATTAFTATGAITGWNLYRRNPGSETYNFVAFIVYGTTTYLDNIDDATVDAGAVAPDPGENDPPDSASFLHVHENRIYLNSLVDLGLAQISNADSATQFASIALPTSLTDGLRLVIGQDADHVLTGIGSLGGLVVFFKPSSYYLFQGSDISNWNLQEQGRQRGCINPFSVQRTENDILFLSGDGIYALNYQAGFVSPKFSWEIDSQFTGFQGVLSPNEPQPFGGVFTPGQFDGNTEGQPWSSQVLGSYINFVRSAYWRQRYFIAYPSKTIGVDMFSRGWFDTGLGPIRWPVVYTGYSPQNIDGLPQGGVPDMMFFSYGGAYGGDCSVYYFTAADTPFDADISTSYFEVVKN